MGYRWRRIIVGGLFVIVLPVAFIAVLVSAGPGEREAAARYAETLSRWPDLAFGIAAAILVGWVVARPVSDRQLRHGALVGVAAGAIDVVILTIAAVSFDWIHLVSVVGVIAGGAAGGALAARGRDAALPGDAA